MINRFINAEPAKKINGPCADYIENYNENESTYKLKISNERHSLFVTLIGKS